MADTFRIFISYRREDSRAEAHFIYWQLAERLPAKLFLDIESITPGADFQASLDVALDSCDVLLALIGNEWDGTGDGPSRLHDQNDFVRREISSALTRDITVIPVLLDGRQMPSQSELPADLVGLSSRQALSMTEQTKLSDVARISREIATLLADKPESNADGRTSQLAEEVAVHQRSIRDENEAAEVARLRKTGLRPALVIQEGHWGSVNTVAFHPKGHWIASGGNDHLIRIWESDTGKVVFVFEGHAGDVGAVAFSPDGRFLASGSADRTVRIWDLNSGEITHCLAAHSYDARSVVFSPDGKTILAAGGDIRLWDAASGQMLRKLDDGWFASFSPDGSVIAAPAHDGIVNIWNAQTGDKVRSLQIAGRNSGLILFSIFTPNGREFLAGCAGSATAGFFDVESGECMQTIETDFDSHGVRCAAMSHDGKCLAVSDGETRFQLWNVESGRVEYDWKKNEPPLIDSICFDRTSDLMVCADRHDCVTLIDRRGQNIRTFEGSNRAETAIGIAPDQSAIAVFSGNKACTVWNVGTAHRICDIECYGLRTARFSANGNYLVLKNNSNMGADVFETTGREIVEVQVQNGLRDIAFSLDNETFAALYEGVDIRRTRTGHRIRQLRSMDWQILSIAFNPANGHLATGCENGIIRFWDPESGRKSGEVRFPDNDVFSISFGPRDRILAAGNGEGSLLLWDLANSRLVKTIKATASPLIRVVFNEDGTMLAGQHYNFDEITVWDAASGVSICTVPGCLETEYFEFTNSGTTLLLVKRSYRNGTEVRMVSLPTGLELATLRAYPDNHWIAVRSDGQYASSRLNPAEIAWRIGSHVFQCSSLHDEYRFAIETR